MSKIINFIPRLFSRILQKHEDKELERIKKLPREEAIIELEKGKALLLALQERILKQKQALKLLDFQKKQTLDKN